MDRKRILLVEDEKESSDLTTLHLETIGYEVIRAYDGHEALQKARKEKLDLIILDLMLPKMDGYKVCRMLKFDEAYKNIPIIMLTGRAQDSDKKLGKEVGADVYITKPSKQNELLDKIRELLGK